MQLWINTGLQETDLDKYMQEKQTFISFSVLSTCVSYEIQISACWDPYIEMCYVFHFFTSLHGWPKTSSERRHNEA